MSENLDVKTKTITNMIWRFAERCGAQGVSFIVSIVLARILIPEDYGMISLVTVFTTIMQVFVDGGLGNALIQKKDADDLDFSSVFYCNLVVCSILYLVIFFAAPYIAAFYKLNNLTPIVRVLGLTIVISGVKGVQQAYVSKKLIFKRFFFATLGGTVGAAVLGIFLACNGFGVWALVAQQIFNTLVDTIILWFTVKWRPKKMFSWNRLKNLYSYGWKLLASNLINTVYENIRQMIIGKVYCSADLAFYNRGRQFPELIVMNINSSIDSVLFPVMSDKQDNKNQIKNMTRKSIMTSSYIMWPLMFGLMAVSYNVVTLILTDKWLACVPYLCIFCLVFGLQPIQTSNLNAIKAMGRSDMYLKMEIIKKSVGMLIIISTMNISVMAIGLSAIVYAIFASIVNAFPNKKLLDYTYFEQLRDIMPSFLLAAFMGACVYAVGMISINIFIKLLLQVIIGVIIYVSGSIIFKFEAFKYLKKILYAFFKK